MLNKTLQHYEYRLSSNKYLLKSFHYLKFLRAILSFNKNVTPQLNDVVVCGMQRSGSTLLFNILKEILLVKLQNCNGFFDEDKE